MENHLGKQSTPKGGLFDMVGGTLALLKTTFRKGDQYQQQMSFISKAE